ARVCVSGGNDTRTIPGATLARLISFSTATDGGGEPNGTPPDGSVTVLFNESGLDPILTSLAKQANHTAKDAGLKLVGGHIVATGASREGRTLDAAGMKAAIIGAIG